MLLLQAGAWALLGREAEGHSAADCAAQPWGGGQAELGTASPVWAGGEQDRGEALL